MKFLLVHFFIAFCLLNVVYTQQMVKDQGLVHMCDSMIYCQGPILDAVNYFRLFNDSKDYVDMPLVKSPEDTLADFNRQFPNKSQITSEALTSFLRTHFLPPGHELLSHVPKDWSSYPSTFDIIKDKNYNAWAQSLNQIWKNLSKKVDIEVLKNNAQYSLVYLSNPFVVPGGRFREYYYWDAFWIIKGLLVSEMYNTTKYMIKNYIDIVNRFGFVPNGGRVYYLKRSQPPMLTSMVYSYYEITGDKAFVREALPTLEKELLFWSTNRAINMTLSNGKTYNVYQYNTPTTAPRPEAYYQDVVNAQSLPESQKPIFWSNIASTAESGWDFGSRWFKDRSTLITTNTKRIVPVDLNAFICGNLRMMSELNHFIGDLQKAKNYQKQFLEFRNKFRDVFYNASSGVWFDYDLDSNLHNVNFYPSTLVPLYTGCFNEKETDLEKSYRFLIQSGAFYFPSGIPTSLTNTSQQWDYPNGWAPLNHMIIEGLRKTNIKSLVEGAYNLADRWLKNNYIIYTQTSYMFEKYDVTRQGQEGGGGEYEVQVGFGWTNGVVLDLLRTYGNLLTAPVVGSPSAASVSVSIVQMPLLVVLLYLAHCLYKRY